MMLGNSEAYNEIYDTYRPGAFIINTLHPAAAQGIVTLLRQRVWKLAYFDGTTAILLKNDPKYAAILENEEVQLSGLKQLEQARNDYASKLGGPTHAGNAGELIGSGKIFLAFNRPKESKAIFSLLLQGNGNIPGAWVGLGNSQMMLKEFDDATASLSKAIELAPNSLFAWASYAEACKYAGNEEERKRASEKARQLAEQRAANAEEPEPVESNDLPEPANGKSLDALNIPE
jgi:tetratricopeptide (TPR) repeat protein